MNEIELRQFIEEKIDQFINVTGCPLTREELIMGSLRILELQFPCPRCRQILGPERLMPWTGAWYHPIYECQARQEGDERPLFELEREQRIINQQRSEADGRETNL